MVISLAYASPRPLQRTPPRPPGCQKRRVPRNRAAAKLPRRVGRNDRRGAEYSVSLGRRVHRPERRRPRCPAAEAAREKRLGFRLPAIRRRAYRSQRDFENVGVELIEENGGEPSARLRQINYPDALVAHSSHASSMARIFLTVSPRAP